MLVIPAITVQNTQQTVDNKQSAMNNEKLTIIPWCLVIIARNSCFFFNLFVCFNSNCSFLFRKFCFIFHRHTYGIIVYEVWQQPKVCFVLQNEIALFEIVAAFWVAYLVIWCATVTTEYMHSEIQWKAKLDPIH